ncbi:MAG: alginate O-acetyltransferase AlgX-related protein [Bacteroidales bacterium]
MKATRHILFILILLGMMVPAMQYLVFELPVKPLVGVQDTLSNPKFSVATFRDMSYQERKSAFLDEKAGFRPSMIRFKNQLDFSVFNYTNSGGVVIGREGCLFLGSYIKNYCGLEFQGVRKINYEVARLALAARELKKKNVEFLLVLAPGKATFNRELIPSRYRKMPLTNYDYYARKLAASGLNVIDMNAWFRQLKPHSTYPLFPENGVHWSSYGVAMAADSMIRYIEKLKSIDMPEMTISKVVMSDSLRYSDHDAGDLMNLLCPKRSKPMPYPEFTFNSTGKHKPDAVIIADSYWWGVITSGISKNIFGKARYWFYGRDIYEEEVKMGTVAGIDIHQELEKQEVVVMLVTEATWMLFPFGFTDTFLKDFKPVTDADREMQVEIMMDNIRRDPKWFGAIVEKAERNHVTAEAQLRTDAQYMIGLGNKGK